MAKVNKRGKAWQVSYRAPDARERTKTFARKVDAERYAVEVEHTKARGSWIDPNDGKVKFAEWCDHWRGKRVRNRASTKARDDSYLRTHILPAFGHAPLSSITHVQVQSWVSELSTRKAPATVGKAFQIMSNVLAYAVTAKKISSNPCEGVELPRAEHREMRFLTPQEVATLADSIDPRYRALVIVGAYGGLRISELAGLKRGRVDVLRNRIEVAEIAVEVSGRVVWGPPKTHAGRRRVALPRFVMDELNEHLVERASAEFVFPSPEGGPLRSPSWRRRFWAPAVKAAGLSDVTPHTLRHTAVALWIAAGANPLEVKRRAGHSSVAFTLDRYGHLFEDADDTLAERLGQFNVAPTTARAVAFPK